MEAGEEVGRGAVWRQGGGSVEAVCQASTRQVPGTSCKTKTGASSTKLICACRRPELKTQRHQRLPSRGRAGSLALLLTR